MKEKGNFVLAQGCLKSDVALGKSPRLLNLFHTLKFIAVQASCLPVAYTRLGRWRLHDSLVQRLGYKIKPVDRICLDRLSRENLDTLRERFIS